MPTIISFASGKGGVGKSTTVSNLGLLLARGGSTVVVVDLDVGGADLHVLFGELTPQLTLSDFIAKKVERLDDVAQSVSWCPRLKVIAGTGETLRNTNPGSSTKKKLERHIRKLNCELVLLDIGAGTNYHALDFFLWGDVRVVISTPDPTAMLDLYKFVKLAATRRVLSELGSRDPAGEALLGEDIRSIQQLMAAARAEGVETEQRAQAALASFSPLLLLNQAGADRAALARINNVIRKFLGSDAEVLGQVPVDPAVVTSVRKFLPVVEAAPEAPAARAYVQVERALRERIKRVVGVSEKPER